MRPNSGGCLVTIQFCAGALCYMPGRFFRVGYEAATLYSIKTIRLIRSTILYCVGIAGYETDFLASVAHQLIARSQIMSTRCAKALYD